MKNSASSRSIKSRPRLEETEIISPAFPMWLVTVSIIRTFSDLIKSTLTVSNLHSACPHYWSEFGRKLDNLVVAAASAHFMVQGRFVRREVAVETPGAFDAQFDQQPFPSAVYEDAGVRRLPS